MALISCRNVKTKRGSMLVVLVLCKTPVYLPFFSERVYLHHGQLHLFSLSLSFIAHARVLSATPRNISALHILVADIICFLSRVL